MATATKEMVQTEKIECNYCDNPIDPMTEEYSVRHYPPNDENPQPHTETVCANCLSLDIDDVHGFLDNCIENWESDSMSDIFPRGKIDIADLIARISLEAKDVLTEYLTDNNCDNLRTVFSGEKE